MRRRVGKLAPFALALGVLTLGCASAERPSGTPAGAKLTLSVTGFGASESVDGRSVLVFQERLLAALAKAGFETTLVGSEGAPAGEGWLLRGRIVDLPVMGATSGPGRVVVHAELLRGGRILLAQTYEQEVFYGESGQGTDYTGDQPQSRAMGLVLRQMVKDVRSVTGGG